ncbi:DUF3303 domain-containing protein [Atribacter laminatus]|uniref:DUF3303 domain-containing protein n=1 Tax=Atribacter laminatus TaxID=2847778 RepID=A0A7T1F2X5_ATRLM|nr:DUF3303 family protein [Atribacter laminatus]QPM68207.1 hypothetical protein RT761_01422 [Atribacter laminatus]
MLFVVLCNAKGGTSKERTERRMTWKAPEGTKLIGEYWLTNEYPNVVQIIEADNVQLMLNAISDWDDFFDISIYPAITAEEGMKNIQEMMK